MKKKVLVCSMFAVFTTVFYYTNSFTSASGPGAGYSSAPGDNTCAVSGCHSGNSVTSNSAAVTINVLDNVTPVTTYTPGKKYNVVISASVSGAGAFGFQTTSKNASNAFAGTFSTGIDPSVKLLSSRYVTHNNSTPAQNGADGWQFQWTAPATAMGDVTLYTSVNAANGDMSSGGDNIHTKSLTLTAASSVGISEAQLFEENISLYPNPAVSMVNVDFSLQAAATVNAGIYSLDGKLVRSINAGMKPAGNHKLNFELYGLESGCYLVHLQAGNHTAVKKLFKQ